MGFVRLAALALALLGLGMGPARAAEPYHLRIGWVVASGDLATLMFAKPGLAPHAGKSYIPELIHFEGTSTSMQALATGAVDTGALAYSTFALGIINAGMDDLRVIGNPLPSRVRFQGVLYDPQIKAFDALLPHDHGVLAATTAFG